MITLKKLKWSNCFSYGEDNEIALDDACLTQIVGDNGTGKSSIPLILEEVLYNKNSKGVKKADIPNRRLDGTYSINLTFTSYDDEYVIDLKRTKTLKIVLTKNGKDISSHTATNTFKTIETILGTDFKTMSQLIYQSTTSSLQFLTATDATRKKFLIDLLNLHKYTEYFETFKELLKDYNLKIAGLSSKVETVENWLVDNDLSHMTVLEPINLEINTLKDEEALASLQVEFKNISETNRKISTNNIYKKQLSELDLDKASSIKVIALQSYDEELREKGALESERTNLNSFITKINKLEDKCPTCEQIIDKEFQQSLISDTEASIEEINAKIIELKVYIDKVKEDNAAYKEKRKIEKDFETLFKAYDDSLPSQAIDPDDISDKINRISEELEAKRKKIKDITEKNLKIERNNTRISVIEEQTDSRIKQLAELQEELVEVQKISTNLGILKKAFSTSGLLAYKIENLVKELEDLVNKYLSELSYGRFTLEFLVEKDKLNVIITDEGERVEIQTLSSGELARVNTATLLAIRKLMNSISKAQINVLFLDEVIGTLDTEGREKLVEVLSEETILNTFIVSHEWTHPLLDKLSVVQDKRISRIEHGS